jgi:hypothetical protein
MLRRTQCHDATGDGSAAVVTRPEPSDHPAGRVADDVNGRGAGLRSGGADRPRKSRGLLIEVPGAIAGQAHDARGPAGTTQETGEGLEGASRTAVAGNEHDRPNYVLRVHPTRTLRAAVEHDRQSRREGGYEDKPERADQKSTSGGRKS